jgi:hypothetical protein
MDYYAQCPIWGTINEEPPLNSWRLRDREFSTGWQEVPNLGLGRVGDQSQPSSLQRTFQGEFYYLDHRLEPSEICRSPAPIIPVSRAAPSQSAARVRTRVGGVAPRTRSRSRPARAGLEGMGGAAGGRHATGAMIRSVFSPTSLTAWRTMASWRSIPQPTSPWLAPAGRPFCAAMSTACAMLYLTCSATVSVCRRAAARLRRWPRSCVEIAVHTDRHRGATGQNGALASRSATRRGTRSVAGPWRCSANSEPVAEGSRLSSSVWARPAARIASTKPAAG